MLQGGFSYKPLCLCICECKKESSPFRSELYKLDTCADEVLTSHLQVVLLHWMDSLLGVEIYCIGPGENIYIW